MSRQPIQQLVEDLRAAFARDPSGPDVKKLVADYVGAHDDWRAYAHPDPDRYTRNLVALDERFELLVLCWNAGQETPVHAHEGQNCWMAVLEGEIDEVHYAWPGETPAPLEKSVTMRYRLGDVGHIHDDIGLHLIRPAGDGPCVSLHLYSLPFRACNIYCPETGRASRKQLFYDTVEGVRAEA